MQDPADLIQWFWLFENLIEGLLLIFTVNHSVTIQLAELNHSSWTFGDSVVEAFSLEIRGVTEWVGVHKRYMP
jgi:hypothetical protein